MKCNPSTEFFLSEKRKKGGRDVFQFHNLIESLLKTFENQTLEQRQKKWFS